MTIILSLYIIASILIQRFYSSNNFFIFQSDKLLSSKVLQVIVPLGSYFHSFLILKLIQ